MLSVGVSSTVGGTSKLWLGCSGMVSMDIIVDSSSLSGLSSECADNVFLGESSLMRFLFKLSQEIVLTDTQSLERRRGKLQVDPPTLSHLREL